MTEETLVPVSPEIKSRIVAKGHVCGICQKWFKRSSDLRRHGSVHSNIKLFPCDHCSLRFASKDRLYQHRKYLSREKTFQCDVCAKSFTSFCNLKLHLIIHTEERPYKCGMCNKTFRRKNALEYHYSSQTYLAHHKKFEDFKQFEYLVEKFKCVIDDGVHICTLCNKQFKSAKCLGRHTLIHTNEKYECDLCGLKFKRENYVLRHKRTTHATNRKFYPCEICKKSFVSNYSVKVHKATIHEQNRPFKCEVCPQAFLLKSSLAKHAIIHNKEKKHACMLCDKRYTTVSSLRYHMREHTGEKPYECEVCNKCFKSTDLLKNHSKKCKQIEITLDTKQNADSKIGVLPQNKSMDSKIGLELLGNKNTDSKQDLNLLERSLTKKTIDQAASKSLSAAKEAFSKGDKVFISQNIKFVKLQNTAELNFLRVTRLFQRYRCLSNVYSK